MNFLKSQFGLYAEAANMQAIIDQSNARFNIPFWGRFFRAGVPSQSLTYVTAIGKSRLDAAATLVSRDGATPLRSRSTIAKLYGDVPAIKVMKKLGEDDYRSFLTFQALQIGDAQKKQQLLNLMFGDIASVVNSVNRRIDYMVLEGISTGKITVTATNNPDGIVQDDVDLLMPAENYLTVAKVWSDPTSTPITDIRNAVKKIKTLNKTGITTMLIDDVTYLQVEANAEVASLMKGYYNPGSNAKYVVTLESINIFMRANRLPVFEIIDEVVPIEVDGVNTNTRPFKKENVVFIPDGMLGEIKNSLAIEELQPVTQVNYSKQGNVLVSKWFSNEPFGEFTKAEWNAFPSFDQIDTMFIMQTDVATVV